MHCPKAALDLAFKQALRSRPLEARQACRAFTFPLAAMLFSICHLFLPFAIAAHGISDTISSRQDSSANLCGTALAVDGVTNFDVTNNNNTCEPFVFNGVFMPIQAFDLTEYAGICAQCEFFM